MLFLNMAPAIKSDSVPLLCSQLSLCANTVDSFFQFGFAHRRLNGVAFGQTLARAAWILFLSPASKQRKPYHLLQIRQTSRLVIKMVTLLKPVNLFIFIFEVFYFYLPFFMNPFAGLLVRQSLQWHLFHLSLYRWTSS